MFISSCLDESTANMAVAVLNAAFPTKQISRYMVSRSKSLVSALSFLSIKDSSLVLCSFYMFLYTSMPC